MKMHLDEISVKSRERMQVINVTSEVSGVIERSGIKSGFVNIWVPHTTAAITVNEHDPDLWTDILVTMEKIAPIKGDYRHNAKYRWVPGEQNAHAHILNSLIKPFITIPIVNGEMVLGTWQSILFIEMDGPQTRTIKVQVIGE
ncbi:secondary thiamine-phosphate synthase enzyme YjbQ [Candidatus Bathyarchaeota archaeon]|nr:secondary thiamine-phosphate synthase enzyme YjbQ [Candidatus Bathyarchaeota archaeon]